MITLIITIKDHLKNIKGFSLIELMVVIVIISVLSSISIVNYIPLRKTALDTTALSDTRNFAESVVEAALDDQDVKYQQGDLEVDGGVKGPIGAFEVDGVTARTPVFSLSPGVAAIITGDINTSIQAYIYHTNGTVDTSGGSFSGRKEYICIIDIPAGLVSLP